MTSPVGSNFPSEAGKTIGARFGEMDFLGYLKRESIDLETAIEASHAVETAAERGSIEMIRCYRT